MPTLLATCFSPKWLVCERAGVCVCVCKKTGVSEDAQDEHSLVLILLCLGAGLCLALACSVAFLDSLHHVLAGARQRLTHLEELTSVGLVRCLHKPPTQIHRTSTRSTINTEHLAKLQATVSEKAQGHFL